MDLLACYLPFYQDLQGLPCFLTCPPVASAVCGSWNAIGTKKSAQPNRLPFCHPEVYFSPGMKQKPKESHKILNGNSKCTRCTQRIFLLQNQNLNLMYKMSLNHVFRSVIRNIISVFLGRNS
jgi:hypothetical protein